MEITNYYPGWIELVITEAIRMYNSDQKIEKEAWEKTYS